MSQPWGGGGGGTASAPLSPTTSQDHVTRSPIANGTVTSYVYSDRDLLTREILGGLRGDDLHLQRARRRWSAGPTPATSRWRYTVDALDRMTFSRLSGGNALDTAYV